MVPEVLGLPLLCGTLCLFSNQIVDIAVECNHINACFVCSTEFKSCRCFLDSACHILSNIRLITVNEAYNMAIIESLGHVNILRIMIGQMSFS